MKLIRILGLAVCMLIGSFGAAQAVSLYVDSAPNAYGSPDYAGWWDNAKQDASDGNFVNMLNSVNPANAGTTNFEIQDAVVYSFGDLGRRLHFVYWLPNTSIELLTGEIGEIGRFQISIEYDDDGVTYDFYDKYFNQTWLEPTQWEDYNGGVIGSAGFAMWGAYDDNTQTELDADIAEWEKSQGNVIIHTRLDGAITSLTAYHQPVPEPSTIILLAAGLGGLAIWRNKRKI